MAGPKAPVGRLSDHQAAAATLARANRDTSRFGSSAPSAAAKEFKNGDFVGSSDDDSSASDSDSSVDSDASVEDAAAFTRRVQQSTAGKRNAAKSPVKKEEPSPSGQQTVNGIKALAQKQSNEQEPQASKTATKPKIVKKETQSDEDDETSSSGDSDSDSEEGESESEGSGGVATKSLVKKVETSDSESDSASSESEEEAVPSAQKTQVARTSAPEVKAASESTSDSESSSEESESDSSDAEAETKQSSESKAQVNGKTGISAQKAESSTSEDEESDESSSSEADSDSEGSASKEDSNVEMADESFALTTSNNGPEVAEMNQVPEVIEPGFQLRKASEDSDATDVAKFFRDARLEGKQVWYFTAPASVPIGVIKETSIPVDRARNGESIMTHNGESYGLSFETSSSYQLIIPSKAGDVYQMLGRPIDQTMHFHKQISIFPPEDHESSRPRAVTAAPKAPRPQPENLRVRFDPIGVPSTREDNGRNGQPSSFSKDDVEMASPPASTPTAKSGKKRKHKDDEDKQDADELKKPEKKTKKQRVEKSTAAAETVKKTPVVPPSVSTNGKASASQPLPTKSSSQKSSDGHLAAANTQPTPSSARKQTPVPLPPIVSLAGKSALLSSPSAPKAEKKPKMKKDKKDKKDKAHAVAETPERTRPVESKKETHISPPKFDRGVPAKK
ncbi:hypothetical protein NKR23_g4860 [Pleurostoma richardsiae]|uniref:DNA-directed RNA polymerase I subunit n=1 Tax=Pleurostoma richardsiae TaxID=41990 RepID=A0AA38VRG5_9PEZI|nr:hypothetical protein NKR23_g4860 [Pleurostoma richardsiae]